jgi:hypothetical protein
MGSIKLLVLYPPPINSYINKKLNINNELFSNKLLKIIIVFILINFSWIFFRAPSITVAFKIIANIFKEFNIWVLFDGSIYKLGLDAVEIKILILALSTLFVSSLYKYNNISIRNKILAQGVWLRWLIYLIGIFSILIFGKYGPEYNTSDFIYLQF